MFFISSAPEFDCVFYFVFMMIGFTLCIQMFFYFLSNILYIGCVHIIIISFQMDKDARWNAAEEDLIYLGLSSQGDIIHLKSVCISNDHAHLQTLAASVKEPACERISGTGKFKQGHKR